MKYILTLVIFVFPVFGFSMEKNGVQMPDEVTVDSQKLVLNGMGMRKKWLISVYMAGLYLKEKTKDAEDVINSEGIKRVDMKFVRSVSAEKIRGAWTSAVEKNCTDHCKENDQMCQDKCKNVSVEIEKLNSWITDVNEGQQMSYVFRQDEVEYFHNSKPLGKVKAPGLGRVLLQAWIGPNPPNESLKNGMLGID